MYDFFYIIEDQGITLPNLLDISKNYRLLEVTRGILYYYFIRKRDCSRLTVMSSGISELGKGIVITLLVELLSNKIGGFCALCDKSVKFSIQLLHVPRIILRSGPAPNLTSGDP